MVQSGILTAQGHDITFIDAIASRMSAEYVMDRIRAAKPEAVLALAADASWSNDVRFLRRLGAAGLAPQLILSGDVPRFEAQRAFADIPDAQAILTDFTDLGAAAFWANDPQPPGIIDRTGTQHPATTRRWSSAPARHDLISMNAYRLPFHAGQPFASVLVNYGCPYSCTFCNTGELGYKLRDIGEAIDELRLVHSLGYRAVYIRDATANGQRTHWLAFCRALTQANLDLRWNVFCTFRPFDAELAQAMADAGCRIIQFGFETASEALRAETGKPFSNEAAQAAVRYCHEAGIRVCGHFVLGLPGQDEGEILASAAFARTLDLDYASFNLAAARPGTHLREHTQSGQLPGGDASNDGFVDGFTDLSQQALKRLRRQAIVRFYLRPRPIRAIVDGFGPGTWRHLATTARAFSRAF